MNNRNKILTNRSLTTYVIIDIIIEDREIPCDDDPKLKECVPPVDCKKTPEDPKCKPTPPPPTCPVLEKDGKTCSPLPDPGGVTPPPSPKPDPLYGGDSFFNGPSPEPAPEEGDTENGEDSTDGESAEDGDLVTKVVQRKEMTEGIVEEKPEEIRSSVELVMTYWLGLKVIIDKLT